MSPGSPTITRPLGTRKKSPSCRVDISIGPPYSRAKRVPALNAAVKGGRALVASSEPDIRGALHHTARRMTLPRCALCQDRSSGAREAARPTYLEDMANERRKPSTMTAKEVIARRHLVPVLGGLKLDHCSTELTIAGLKAHLRPLGAARANAGPEPRRRNAGPARVAAASAPERRYSANVEMLSRFAFSSRSCLSSLALAVLCGRPSAAILRAASMAHRVAPWCPARKCPTSA